VVAIGASAGGLDACRKLLAAMPADCGMALILVQHLDPTHDSMLVDLLANNTPMPVVQAADAMLIEPGHLYVIPPGTYLSVESGAIRLSQPNAPRGARLPFDFLLASLAAERGEQAIGVVLSGTGADGTLGLCAVREAGGLVIAQDPQEAGYPGMPQSAIDAGIVDQVLQAALIPAALASHRTSGADHQAGDWLPAIIELLRTRTAHDFTLYKPGTLRRRIERRTGLAGVAAGDMERYIQQLRSDPSELNLLAKDLLINVTSFFRDPAVFDALAASIVPDLVRAHASDNPLRIWIAGCSTGQETYSLAMLFREAITAEHREIKLQVFASDIDPDAIVAAREGLYPDTIAAEVTPARLARFFTKEPGHYRVTAELRSCVVFTVQDVLADPPFSRIDFVSCRNLLIYLKPEAQERVIGLFHFALRQGGILLLGNSETITDYKGVFEVLSKPERLYRHTGHGRPGEVGFVRGTIDGLRPPARQGRAHALSRQAALAELCRRLVMDSFAPAAILINRQHEVLYSVGPTERYLRVASGHPTHDLLSLVRPGLRSRLETAIKQAVADDRRATVHGGRIAHEAGGTAVAISAQPVRNDGEALLLVCFLDDPKSGTAPGRTAAHELPRVQELERELAAVRAELQTAVHNLDVSGEEQKAINEEALSVQEEYQSTNEELLTSKEELQSLNEELTALNGQLQETLERQRTTANDLQNVLYSTDVATLFLDSAFKIRFFTPATRSLFNIIPGDIGRPISDLRSLSAADGDLLTDARTVIRTLEPVEREIETESGACYLRRVLPYRTKDAGIEGIVVTFVDITDRRRIADELGVAKRHAEQANAAKSRFLAAASHDLRQPLQTLTLVQGMLARHVDSDRGRALVVRLDQTLGAMAGMLNALLDINQIEAGTVHAEVATFPVSDLLGQLRDEFQYHAQSKGLKLRVVPCSLTVRSDPRLLEQMIRNLVSNALKYTKRGKVLLGCRRHQGMLRIEVWDTGIGIPDEQLDAIFEEYHQIDNPARERSHGLGLGLSIVQRLGTLLGHPVHVRSCQGKGSVFSIDVGMPQDETVRPPATLADGSPKAGGQRLTGTILVVEDDPDVRDLLEAFLRDEGHTVATALDGASALEMVATGLRPDILLTDYNLPSLMNGAQVVTRVRQALGLDVPAIILTGDISTGALERIRLENVVHLNKPVKLRELTEHLQRKLAAPRAVAPSVTRPPAPRPAEAQGPSGPPVVFVVDDDDGIREAVRAVLEDEGRLVEDFASCEAFLAAFKPGREGCLIVDAYLPGMTGLALLQQLHDGGDRLPAIMITGNSDVNMAVQAMKAGALDFIEKPIGREDLVASVDRALEQSHDTSKLLAWRSDAAGHMAGLTTRQRQVMDMVLAGHPSKNIAADLGISQRTVENHRASIMARTGSKSLPALARLALAATGNA
jgi:two-component system CheB/CheR fusion protein